MLLAIEHRRSSHAYTGSLAQTTAYISGASTRTFAITSTFLLTPHPDAAPHYPAHLIGRTYQHVQVVLCARNTTPRDLHMPRLCNMCICLRKASLTEKSLPK